MANKFQIKSTNKETRDSHYQNLLEIARLVSWCMNRDYIIKSCLDHLCKRLKKRARCVLAAGDELKIQCWVGKYACPVKQVPVCRDSVVWKVIAEGNPINLTDPKETNGYRHTLKEKIKLKAIIPLWFVNSTSQEEERVGALIVDCGKEGVPVSLEDFEYLKVVGELIGSAIGRAELVERLLKSYRTKEAIVKETAHAFRNRITTIGGFSRRLVQSAKNTNLIQESQLILKEVKRLEAQVDRFEKYMDI